jgi:predicted metalloprotease with PDZ domain
MMAAQPTPVCYQVRAGHLHAHLYHVTLTIAQPVADQVVSLPVWIPGSYLVREFAKHLQGLQARQGKRAVALTQLDKCSWQVHGKAGQPLVLTYEVYAFDASVRTAWLDTQRGFFNGTSLCLRVHGQEDAPHQLHVSDLDLPKDWHLATALPPVKVDKKGFGSYLAASYDELADSPVEMGAFWSGNFTACGVPHRFVVAGAPASFDGARLLADAQTICETEIVFWHGQNSGRKASRAKRLTPHDRYVFMLNAVENSNGGLEHRHSTALICKRADLPRLGQAKTLTASDGYTTLLGLISHEYFHTWNVKRLRPAEFARYNYAQENYTELLWFFEGFTNYYDDLLLRRAGLIDDATYLGLLGKTINAVLQTPGRLVQSVAQSSFDAWVKYYRQDENTANATVSYYTLGSLVALCLDLSLRQHGQASLDAVMRGLWQRCAGGPMTEADVLAVVADLSSPALAAQVAHWVHRTTALPLKQLLMQQGVNYQEDQASLANQLGLCVSESNGCLRIKSVLRGGAAEQAGLAAGDEWLGIEVVSAKIKQSWRINKLDDLPLYLGSNTCFDALICRDQRLLSLSVALPPAVQQVKLVIHDLAIAGCWLANN